MSTALPIVEIFESIQGEGIWMGMPSVFVRVAGCNLSCSWCDTPYAHDSSQGQARSTDDICAAIAEFTDQHVVITGGEPTLYPDALIALCARLSRKGKKVTLETNTTRFVPCEIALASLSPKLPGSQSDDRPSWDAEVIARYIAHAPDTHVKIVVRSSADVRTAMALVAAMDVPREHVFLTPAARTPRELLSAAEWLAPQCALHNARFGARLQTLMWNNTPGR